LAFPFYSLYTFFHLFFVDDGVALSTKYIFTIDQVQPTDLNCPPKAVYFCQLKSTYYFM